jgi:hypothetical protein
MSRRALTLAAASIGLALAVGAPGCSGSGSGSDTRPSVVVPGAAGAAGGDIETTAGAPSSGGSTSDNGAGGAAGASTSAVGGAALGGAAGAPSDGGGPDLPNGGAPPDCAVVVQQQALAAGIHVAACSAIDYATNPPSSGEHYPIWADFGAYDFPLPRGYWVHNLEHGAVVVTYNCPLGCADEVARASAWLAQLAPDAACAAGPARALLVPDPKLDVRWAASSWGFTLRAPCFDKAEFTDFYLKHVGQPLAPEAALCGTGVDFRADGADTCGAK